MARTYDPEAYMARRFSTAREAFATRKSNRNAANLLRCALNAEGSDLINDEELEGVLFDVIDYLEGN
jgi:hypothetical protein